MLEFLPNEFVLEINWKEILSQKIILNIKSLINLKKYGKNHNVIFSLNLQREKKRKINIYDYNSLF